MNKILEKLDQLSPLQQMVAEIMIYAYMVDKTKGIKINRGKYIDSAGNEKILYQIEVSES